MLKNCLLLIFFGIFSIGFAQNDDVERLDEILLFGRFSPIFQNGFSTQIISDSILVADQKTLTDFLRDEANFYFKEYGRGMVSAVALRGTTASQTAVYWNGIPINSSLNGQTDFNTLNTQSVDKIEIKKGGGSVLLGSGAVGGAVNLSEDIIFGKDKKIEVNGGLGSFATYFGGFDSKFSNHKVYLRMTGSYLQSENDYDYPKVGKNENGAFQNYNINISLGYKLNAKNEINFYNSYVNNDRNLSGTLTAISRSKLENKNYRTLLEWKNGGKSYISSLKLTYLSEDYLYYPDNEGNDNLLNEANNLITTYDFSFHLKKNLMLSSGLDFIHSSAEGDDLESSVLNRFEAFLLLNQEVGESFVYNLSMRKGTSNLYNIPFIYAFDGAYKINSNLRLRGNFGTNYRLPTFNDLYWKPGGNPDLKAEESFSGEIGLQYQKQKMGFEIAAFYIKNENLIQWVPQNADFWQPQNIDESAHYGVELGLNYGIDLNEHQLNFQSQYAYTIATDIELDKQLIYNPKQKWNNILSYSVKNFDLKYYLQYTGKVYTTTSNSQNLSAFWISNIRSTYNLKKFPFKFSAEINNLFNQSYQIIAYRPMPGVNCNVSIQFQI